MSESGYVETRGCTEVTLDFIREAGEVLFPENVLLKLKTKRKTLDIGSLAFKVRGDVYGAGENSVQLDSLIVGRRELVLSLLDYFSRSQLADTTINQIFGAFVYFVSWCDRSSGFDLFSSVSATRESYIGYCEYLRHRISVLKDLNALTASSRQRLAKDLIAVRYPDDVQYIVSGVQKIRAVRISAEPPAEHHVRAYVDVCLHVATEFSRFLMNGEPFPAKIKFPDFSTYIYPGRGQLVTPYHSPIKGHAVHDFANGRIKELEECLEARPNARAVDVRMSRDGAIQSLRSANKNRYCNPRMRYAAMVMEAYAVLINLAVGASGTEFVQFLYEDAQHIQKSPLKKELSAVKFRAKGKTTRYSLGRGAGLALLRKYLEFREWVIGGKSSRLLFFKVIDVRGGLLEPIYPLESMFSSKFFKKLSGVFLSEDFKNVTPSSTRKFKSIVLHQLRYSPALVSGLLNHTEQVNGQSYNNISVESQETELSKFWSSVRKAAGRVRVASADESKSIPVGHCDLPNSPESDEINPDIVPNCRTQFGCLYCSRYSCHADREDIHKLLSLRYVIEFVRGSSRDVGHAEALFKGLILRIGFILDAIRGRSEEASKAVDELLLTVDELGILTTFWEERIQRYEKMGFLI